VTVTYTNTPPDTHTPTPTATESVTHTSTPTETPTATRTVSPESVAAVSLVYPNPFWPTQGGKTNIALTLVDYGNVNIKAFNMAGVLVRTVADQDYPNGRFTFTWDGRNDQGEVVGTGMYILLISAPGINEQKLVGVLK
jgi:FlgD Ig-like domain